MNKKKEALCKIASAAKSNAKSKKKIINTPKVYDYYGGHEAEKKAKVEAAKQKAVEEAKARSEEYKKMKAAKEA